MTVVGVLGAMFLAVTPVPVVLRALFGAASVTLGVALSWRASHMFVDVHGRTLTVHGWLRPRLIPVDRVTAAAGISVSGVRGPYGRQGDRSWATGDCCTRIWDSREVSLLPATRPEVEPAIPHG